MPPAGSLNKIFPEVLEKRQSDPILDEICRDLEELMGFSDLSAPHGAHSDERLQQDFDATINALRQEITSRLKIS